MSHTALLVNGSTTIIGMVMLCMMAYGTWRFGFVTMFTQRLGRATMALGVIDLLGLICWS